MKKGDRVVMLDGKKGTVSGVVVGASSVDVDVARVILDSVARGTQGSRDIVRYTQVKNLRLEKEDRAGEAVAELETLPTPADWRGYSNFSCLSVPHTAGPRFPHNSNCEACKEQPYPRLFTFACPAVEDGPEVEITSAYAGGYLTREATLNVLATIRRMRRYTSRG